MVSDTDEPERQDFETRKPIVATELKRINDVRAQSLPGHEALIEGPTLDGKTTGAETAEAVAAAEQARLKYEKSCLYKLCKQHAISSDIEDDLKDQVRYLVCFKKEILPGTQTETKRAMALKKIEQDARKLISAINALSFEDHMALDNEFFSVDEPDFEDLFYIANDSQNFDVAARVLPRLERAAKASSERLASVGKSGAPNITKRQADFIRCIAQVLSKAEIAPKGSGKFLEFCTAIFKDAGLTLPNRAIRYFIKEVRPNLKASGCL